MKKYVAPEVFEYEDDVIQFETTDKRFAVLAFEYVKKNIHASFEKYKQDTLDEFEADIQRLTSEIELENDK